MQMRRAAHHGLDEWCGDAWGEVGSGWQGPYRSILRGGRAMGTGWSRWREQADVVGAVQRAMASGSVTSYRHERWLHQQHGPIVKGYPHLHS